MMPKSIKSYTSPYRRNPQIREHGTTVDLAGYVPDQILRYRHFAFPWRGEFVRWGCDVFFRHETQNVSTKIWRLFAAGLYI